MHLQDDTGDHTCYKGRLGASADTIPHENVYGKAMAESSLPTNISIVREDAAAGVQIQRRGRGCGGVKRKQKLGGIVSPGHKKQELRKILREKEIHIDDREESSRATALTASLLTGQRVAVGKHESILS